MMLSSRSTSLSLVFLLLIGVVVLVLSVAAQTTDLNDEEQHPALINSADDNIEKSGGGLVVQEPGDSVAGQEALEQHNQHDNDHHHDIANTGLDLSPPPPLVKQEKEDEKNVENTESSETTLEYFPLLQERISSIQVYLNDPMFYLIDMDVDSYMQQADLSLYSIPPSNLVAILEDLEFHLENNRTMALEFYALGGWQLVASLLAPAAHGVVVPVTAAAASSSHDDNQHHGSHSHSTSDVHDKILVIRAYATSLLGSIVKRHRTQHNGNDNNHNGDDNDDVSSWVIAEVQIEDVHDMTTMRTTALNLVAQAMVEVSSRETSSVPAVVQQKCSDNTIEYEHQLAKECMHTLEAFLHHGNHAAHVAFSTLWTTITPSTAASASSMTAVDESIGTSSSSSSSSSPAKILGHQVAIWAQQADTTAADTESSNAPMSRHSIDMATRLLRLAKDMVDDVDHLPKQQQSDDEEARNKNLAILNVLSTNDWCNAAMQAATLTPSNSFKRLVFANLQKTALQAIVKLGPHCSHYYHRHDNQNNDQSHGVGVADLIRLHEQLVHPNDSSNNNGGHRTSPSVQAVNKDRERERIQLVEEALAAVMTTTGTETTTTTTLQTPEVANEQ